MANTIQIKRKTTTGAPTIGALSDGEMCLVVPDSELYLRVDGTELIKFIAEKKYSETIGDGVTTVITITHNLGTEDLSSVFLLNLTSKEEEGTFLNVIDANSITLSFGTAPTTNKYRVTIKA